MIKKLFNYLKLMYDRYKYAFYSAIFFTFISHVYFFVKRLGNEDDLNFIYRRNASSNDKICFCNSCYHIGFCYDM